jgi:hypothetical protein
VLELRGMATATIDVLETPIARIRQTCETAGASDRLDQALPELATYLEGDVAKDGTSETRLTYSGLCFLKELFAQSQA